MLAGYIRAMLLLEIAGYAAIAEWLHFLYGWPYGALAALAVAAALLARFAMVSVTTATGLIAGRPRAPEHRIGAAATATLVLREWTSVLCNNFVLLSWERWALRADPPRAPASTMPVLLVHGYFSNRGYFRPLVRALEAGGAGPVFTPNFPAAFASIEDFVRRLEREIDDIAEKTGQRVVLVCHSMGGLAARAYLCRHGAARVAKLVTIASPHHGTLHAYFGAGANARQMRRGSRFLAEVCAKEGERGPDCPVTSIYTPHDNLVAPQETSRLAWAKNVALPGLGHLDILRSPRLARIVLDELREAGAM